MLRVGVTPRVRVVTEVEAVSGDLARVTRDA